MSKKGPIALVGFGDSRSGVFDLDPEIPIWTMNNPEPYGFPRIDRLFDIHPIRVLEFTGRMSRYRNGTPYPVYLIDVLSDVPRGVAYPLDQVLDEVFDLIYVGDDRAEYLTSTFPYMVALAVLEGYGPIKTFGFEFGSDTEWRYQREGAALLVGWAAGRGIRIEFPEGNTLIPRTLYGYTDYQMIHEEELIAIREDLVPRYHEANARIPREKTPDDQAEAFKEKLMLSGGIQIVDTMIETVEDLEAISRQSLEGMLNDLVRQHSVEMSRTSSEHNIVIALTEVVPKIFADNGDLPEGIQDQVDDRIVRRDEAFRQLYIAGGAIQVVQYLIGSCDRKVSDRIEFKDLNFVVEDGEEQVVE